MRGSCILFLYCNSLSKKIPHIIMRAGTSGQDINKWNRVRFIQNFFRRCMHQYFILHILPKMPSRFRRFLQKIIAGSFHQILCVPMGVWTEDVFPIWQILQHGICIPHQSILKLPVSNITFRHHLIMHSN